jgi:histidinol-phosphate phosphatase family protein
MAHSFDIVVPTTGRPSLAPLQAALAGFPGRVIVVEDARRRGPAWARNQGWWRSEAEWICFLDDDVVPEPDWLARLAEDLSRPGIAGSQGRIVVPLPFGRRPTDRERNVHGLETATWATADMAYRRDALAAVGGFDERFPRAYREDADLALRMLDAGFRLERGRRRVVHPVGSAGPLASLRLQAGNADDALMDRLHGLGWRERAVAPPGRRRRHLAVAAAGTLTMATRSRLLGAAWLAGTAELAWARIAPGPRTAGEVATMAATSAAMPFVASAHWLSGLVRAHRLASRRPEAVLLDRDGTLVRDVPYNGDPGRVVPLPGAREALERLRKAGVATAVVSNQSGVARGLVTMAQVDAVNRRVDELLGPVGPWLVCPHGPDDGCACRKPAPGLVVRAAEALGVDPRRCAVIGDIGADVVAARAAGARPVLVPTAATRRNEIEAAPEVAPTLLAAVERLLGSAR